jgi:glycerol-3-phosphate cytidylyltransferase
MKKVLTVGVFDLFHIGHLNLFRRAKEYGDYLIVAVHNDLLMQKGKDFIYSLQERVDLISALKMVDETVMYERVDLLVAKIDFDVFVFGEDQNHEYFQKAFQWCIENRKELIMLKRTEGISSTFIRKVLEKKEI